MKINHMAVYVRDLEGIKDFFVRFFNAQAGPLYQNPKTGFKSYFLSFGGGSRLEVMTRPALVCSSQNMPCAGYAHIAFSVGSKTRVDEVTQRLSSAGYVVVSGPRRTGDGYYESCICGPENNLIEITE